MLNNHPFPVLIPMTSKCGFKMRLQLGHSEIILVGFEKSFLRGLLWQNPLNFKIFLKGEKIVGFFFKFTATFN